MFDDSLQDNNPPAVADLRQSVSAQTLIVVFLGGMFIIAVLTVCYVASSIIMPIVLAGVLKLVLQPMMRRLATWRVPRILAAFLVILFILGLFVGLGAAFSLPATQWAQQLPTALPKMQEKLNPISSAIKTGHKMLARAEGLSLAPASNNVSAKVVTVALPGSSMSDKLYAGTQHFVGAFFQMIIVLFFMLMSGDTFLRRLVEVLPRFEEKKQAITISQQIESDISAYLITVTVMNALVGILTAAIMFFCGISDPLLWGVIAFLMNYVPILGPLIAAALFFMVGMMMEPTLASSLLPAGLYLCIHLIEGEAVTPMLLAKRFTLNPVLVIITLVFWYWMWGVPGAVLSTPMLAIVKIVCDRIEGLKAFGHFIEG